MTLRIVGWVVLAVLVIAALGAVLLLLQGPAVHGVAPV